MQRMTTSGPNPGSRTQNLGFGPDVVIFGCFGRGLHQKGPHIYYYHNTTCGVMRARAWDAICGEGRRVQTHIPDPNGAKL